VSASFQYLLQQQRPPKRTISDVTLHQQVHWNAAASVWFVVSRAQLGGIGKDPVNNGRGQGGAPRTAAQIPHFEPRAVGK
jgi:hypothetical protein